ncbi:bifunctional helix-turn-helix transcriptional regulator/GNAT family N-acetyltransferase [Dyella caseinilytica]|uniref:Bifunctional helix-turn-helix transcriptional regulator/GNAT family N-acetyltransferase n=1 Tax=Dyella caseinilytica TaxID=1849581 RepID=A0ABX7GR64_9GAMM|nr:bifunctional helix-turn-helix transcriptional regulator/GNAT family N-acetyltransferase [Dyella caseinilytica]QRN52915.1 bifunctional helix-turn-helix transcriptional regulator/GNAT family N-acetyltransferase [Dyella caseinilytica]GGA09830.1 MarR family transcriptional regulator [Dyella caseinilytica]
MYLESLGKLALGSRLKALSDHFYGAVDEVYQARGARIESRWMPVLRYLSDIGPSSVTEVADAIGQTHSAVSQLTDKLVRAGMVRRRRDPADGRRTVLTLTEKANSALAELGPLWCAVRRGVSASLGENAMRLLDMLAACEGVLKERPMAAAILAEHDAIMSTPLEIVPYEPALREHFYRLNAQWLERYFRIEDIDRAVLTDPERYILQPGGAIFFAHLGEDVIGTCALLQESPGVYELTKMGVDETFRGMGAGKRLLDAAIAEFHRRKGKTLFLESSSRLKPALGMYEKAGFHLQPNIRPDSHYERADVYMIYQPA